MAQGTFITLEGGEGAGKSTLSRGLADALTAKGRAVVTTREPGGAPGADAIRALLVSGEANRWSALEEALLIAAARANHLSQTVRPALEAGSDVICDRYIDSTYAYQVAAGGLSANVLAQLNTLIDAPAPDLTFVLDLDPEAGLGRSRGAVAGEDRFEKKGAGFHAKVRAAFLDIAAREPQRCVVLDASKEAHDVLADALKALESRL